MRKQQGPTLLTAVDLSREHMQHNNGERAYQLITASGIFQQVMQALSRMPCPACASCYAAAVPTMPQQRLLEPLVLSHYDPYLLQSRPLQQYPYGEVWSHTPCICTVHRPKAVLYSVLLAIQAQKYVTYHGGMVWFEHTRSYPENCGIMLPHKVLYIWCMPRNNGTCTA
jgi:hypothetical protein